MSAESSAAKLSVYTTTDDERKAREVVETLWYERARRAMVMRVNEAVHMDLPLVNPKALRTSDRYAVIAKASRG